MGEGMFMGNCVCIQVAEIFLSSLTLEFPLQDVQVSGTWWIVSLVTSELSAASSSSCFSLFQHGFSPHLEHSPPPCVFTGLLLIPFPSPQPFLTSASLQHWEAEPYPGGSWSQERFHLFSQRLQGPTAAKTLTSTPHPEENLSVWNEGKKPN